MVRYSDGSLSPDATSSDLGKTPSNEENEFETTSGFGQVNMTNQLTGENVDTGCAMPFELYKRLTTVVCSMEHFLDVVCGALEQYKYFGPNQRADLLLACRYIFCSLCCVTFDLIPQFCNRFWFVWSRMEVIVMLFPYDVYSFVIFQILQIFFY